MDILFQILEMIGPTIVGILTVPLFGYIKKLATFVDAMPAWAQQIGVVVVAAVLSWLGAMSNVVLPESLSLFTEADVSALLSAAMAFGIHAGKKRITDGA